MSEPDIEVTVTDTHAGLRVDVFLVRAVEGMSRSLAKAAAQAGNVRINGRRCKKASVVVPGDTVRLSGGATSKDFVPVKNEEIPVRLIHEDEHVLVVDKPAGVPSHPLVATELETLCNWLMAKYPDVAQVGYSQREPGIVHRLDTDTSGLMIVARNAPSFDALIKSLRTQDIDKEYLAVVDGVFPKVSQVQGFLSARRGSKTVDVSDEPGERARQASLEVLEVEVQKDRSTIKVRVPKATRHQVRALLSYAGHPIIGDELYGGPERELHNRHLLHASWIRFTHPVTGETLEFSCPPPWAS